MRAALSSVFGGLATNHVARRLVSGTAANFLGKVWTLLVQLTAIPLMSYHWGPEGYGLWLMVSTIPTYVALTDFGLATAASVEMTRSLERGEQSRTLRIFQSAWMPLTLVVGVIVAAAVGFAIVSHQTAQIGTELAWAITGMAVYSFIAMQMMIIAMVYRASGRYALGTTLLDLSVPLEGVAIVAVTMSGHGLATLCWVLVAIRLVALFGFYATIASKEKWLSLGWRHFDKPEFKRLLLPSAGGLALTAANALVLQGTVLTLGLVAGAAAAGVFGATRFITRIPLQFSSLLSRASIPELTRAIENGNAPLQRRLLLANVASSVVMTVPAAIIIGLVGPHVLDLISHGQLVATNASFICLGIAAVLNAIWTSLMTPLQAYNQHARVAAIYLLAAISVTSSPLLLTAGLPDEAFWLALVICELVALAAVCLQLRSGGPA